MKGFRAMGCLGAPALPGPGGLAELAQPGTKQGSPRTGALQGVEHPLHAARPSSLFPPAPHPTHPPPLLSHEVAGLGSAGVGGWPRHSGWIPSDPANSLRAAHAAARPRCEAEGVPGVTATHGSAAAAATLRVPTPAPAPCSRREAVAEPSPPRAGDTPTRAPRRARPPPRTNTHSREGAAHAGSAARPRTAPHGQTDTQPAPHTDGWTETRPRTLMDGRTPGPARPDGQATPHTDGWMDTGPPTHRWTRGPTCPDGHPAPHTDGWMDTWPHTHRSTCGPTH